MGDALGFWECSNHVSINVDGTYSDKKTELKKIDEPGKQEATVKAQEKSVDERITSDKIPKRLTVSSTR